MNDKPTILYIDDEPINVMLFEINFRKKYNVITALSGFEGIEKLKTNKDIKIVLSDMKMPEMSGIDFIIKAKEEFPTLNYFILTGFDVIHEIAEALNTKLVEKYFCKPFNIPEIDKAIGEAIYN